ncbi:MAG: polysaccharide biosynthesis C-terminal domain-containing protein [Bacilli bacterium]|nr:polysaccharide biosynthesis C-terminal domain-containing protein [Bacilli bacterium]
MNTIIVEIGKKMRTKMLLKASIIEVLPVLLIAFLGIIKIDVFISYIGSDMNGYYQFIIQIISYLFLVEAGLGSAVTFQMYKPFASNDMKRVGEIYKGSLKIFRKIGIIILIMIILFSIAFRFIFNTTISNYIIITASFICISVSYTISFFFGSKSVISLFSSNQKKYIPATVSNIFKILLEIITIVTILIFKSLIAVAIVTLVLKIFEEIVMNLLVKRIYKLNLNSLAADTSALKFTKHLVWHQFGYVVFNNVDSTILMWSQGPVIVSIYSVYNYIIKFLLMLFEKISSTALHILGDVFAKEKEGKSLKIYNDYLFFCFILALVLSLSFLIGARSFITNVWIKNGEYLIDVYTITLFALTIFMNIIFSPLTAITTANGLFKESKYYTTISSFVNLILSVIMVKYFGISGVLLATNVAYVIDIVLRLKLIENHIFSCTNFWYYARRYLLYILTFIFSALIVLFFETKYLKLVTNYFSFFKYMLPAFIIILSLLTFIACRKNERIKCLLLKMKKSVIKRM